MTHVTCRLTAKNRDHLRNPTLGNRVRAIFTFFKRSVSVKISSQVINSKRASGIKIIIMRPPHTHILFSCFRTAVFWICISMWYFHLLVFFPKIWHGSCLCPTDTHRSRNIGDNNASGLHIIIHVIDKCTWISAFLSHKSKNSFTYWLSEKTACRFIQQPIMTAGAPQNLTISARIFSCENLASICKFCTPPAICEFSTKNSCNFHSTLIDVVGTNLSSTKQ